MAQQEPAPQGTRTQGDPWHAFGYLVSGVAVYGLIGWGLDRWLGTEFLVVVGILFGSVLGIYMTWARFNKPEPQDPPATRPGQDTT